VSCDLGFKLLPFGVEVPDCLGVAFAELLDSGDEVSYTIVAGDYLDLEANQVSLASPLGRATVGRAEGEEFVCSLPAGEKRFRVLELTTLPQMLEQDSAGDSGD
jgi:hypothetical protein